MKGYCIFMCYQLGILILCPAFVPFLFLLGCHVIMFIGIGKYNKQVCGVCINTIVGIFDYCAPQLQLFLGVMGG